MYVCGLKFLFFVNLVKFVSVFGIVSDEVLLGVGCVVDLFVFLVIEFMVLFIDLDWVKFYFSCDLLIDVVLKIF